MEVLQTASRELEDALATPPPPAAATKAKRDQCGDWCAARPGGTDSHCVTDCQAEMYQCNDHNTTRTEEKAAHDGCVAKVQAKFTAASAQNPETTDAHLLAKKADEVSKRDHCGNWCAGRPGGADSHCVTDCQAEMYQCNDHNKTRTEEKAAHDDWVAKVQAKFSAASTQSPDTTDAHLLAKKAKGPASTFSNTTATKLRRQQDTLSKLFQHLKENVAKFNKREKEGKAEAEKAVKDMEQRLEKDRDQLKNPKLSAFEHELITNRTRTEEAELTFRKQDHFYQHNMFHANLKATHGLMSRVSGVLEAYKQALTTGHVDPNIKAAMIKSLSSQPKALVETRSQLRKQRTLSLRGSKRL